VADCTVLVGGCVLVEDVRAFFVADNLAIEDSSIAKNFFDTIMVYFLDTIMFYFFDIIMFSYIFIDDDKF
jgi:hypothetical protein